MTELNLILYSNSQNISSIHEIVLGAEKHDDLSSFCDQISRANKNNLSYIAILICDRIEKFNKDEVCITSQKLVQKCQDQLKAESNWLVFVELTNEWKFRVLTIKDSTVTSFKTLSRVACDCNGNLLSKDDPSLINSRFYKFDFLLEAEQALPDRNSVFLHSLQYIVRCLVADMQGLSSYSPNCRIAEINMNPKGLTSISSQLLLIPEFQGDFGNESVRLSSLYLLNSASTRLGAVEVTGSEKWLNVTSEMKRWEIEHCQYKSPISISEHSQPISTSISQAIKERRAATAFSKSSVSLRELASLLCIGAGARKSLPFKGKTLPRRTYPTAGSLATAKILLLNNRIEDLEDTLYYYEQDSCSLLPLKLDLKTEDIAVSSAYKDKILDSSFILFFIVDLSLLGQKYRERAARLALIEIGHIAQNLIMVATGLNISTCPIAGFDEVMVSDRLKMHPPFLYTPYLLLCGKQDELQIEV